MTLYRRMRNICLALMVLNMLPGLQSRSKVLKSGVEVVSPDNSKWGDWDMCPNGSFAFVFNLILDEDQDGGDDTAVNGIYLSCAKPSAPMTIIQFVKSSVGLYGKFRNGFFCDNGVINGFQLRNLPYRDDDNFAITNMKVFCSNLGKSSPIEGDGIPGGEYAKPVMCKNAQAVCGLRTLVDRVMGPDNTGLNDVEMMCCDIPNPNKNCKAKDYFEDLVTCDNLGGKLNSGANYYLNCTYAQTIGVTDSAASSSEGFDESELFGSLGFSAGGSGGLLGGIFSASVKGSLEASSKTGTKWTKESSRTFSKSTTSMAFFTVPPGFKVVLQQAIASCGMLKARSTKFRKLDYKMPKRGINFKKARK